MSIAKIKKLELIGLQPDKERILSLLQKLAIVELIDISQRITTLDYEREMEFADETQLLEIEEAISFFTGFQPKSGLLEGMVKLKPLVYQEELQKVLTEFDYQGLLKELLDLRNKLNQFLQAREKLKQEKFLLMPWQNLEIPLERIRQTQKCGVLLGALPSTDLANLEEDFAKENLNLFLDTIYEDKASSYLALLYLKEEFERLEILLKGYRFNLASLPRHKISAKERLLRINTQLLQIDGQIKISNQELEGLAQQRFKLMVVYDYLANIKNRKDQEKNLAKQVYTFYLSGWIRDKDIQFLEKNLKENFSDIALFISEPALKEDIPTALENKPVVQPFEVVTNLYGQPLPTGLDPTGFLAPFFALSFGFCLMDAGYGLMLLVISLFFLKKKQITSSGKKFLKLFLYMGIATIFAGLITGSFFGDLIYRLPEQIAVVKNIQKRLVIFDPIKDALLFLGLTLALGFIQIWTGVGIKFLKDLRQDKFSAFILDLPTLLIQTSLFLLVLIFTKVLPGWMLKYVVILFITQALLIIYYQLKTNREISLKIFWSIFGIYSIIMGNFLADTLSFSRIFALGLTGGLLGMAINTMLFPKGPISGLFGWLGALLAIFILFLGHIINFAITILGAYVHTSRLQYLEFFTKFFDSGGRPFRPFKEETKYIFLAENKYSPS